MFLTVSEKFSCYLKAINTYKVIYYKTKFETKSGTLRIRKKNINHSFKTTCYLDVPTSCNSKLMSRHNKPKGHKKTVIHNLIVVNLKSTTGKQNHIKHS